MKKRFLTLALVLALCLSMAVPALAAPVVGDDSVAFQDAGVTLRISDVAYCETIQVATGNAHLADDWSVREVPVFHVQADAAISVQNDGETLAVIYGDQTGDFLTYDPWATTWELRQEDGVLSTGFGEEIAIRELDAPALLPKGETTELVSVTKLPVPHAADGALNSVRLTLARAGTPGAGANMYDVTIWYTVGETPLLGDAEQAPTVPTTDPTTTTPVFSDVKNTDWFADPVKWAVEQKITTGTTATTFSPTQDCSVAQILTFLWRAAGSPEAKGIDGMDANLYYAGAVAWAVEKGMISAEDFTATAPCTRSMAVQFIWQAADSPKADAASFEDVPADAEYADAVAWAVKEGVTTGTSETTFAPDTVCNRGHIVTFLYRAFGPAEPVQSSAPAQSAVDIAEMTGTFVLESKPKYEMIVTFYTPKLYITVNNTLTGKTLLTGNLSVSGNAAYTQDGVRITAYPGYLILELSKGREHLQGTIGGKYILSSDA